MVLWLFSFGRHLSFFFSPPQSLSHFLCGPQDAHSQLFLLFSLILEMPAEEASRYATTEQEALAVEFTISRLQMYLAGGKHSSGYLAQATTYPIQNTNKTMRLSGLSTSHVQNYVCRKGL